MGGLRGFVRRARAFVVEQHSPAAYHERRPGMERDYELS